MPIQVNWYEEEKQNIWYHITDIETWQDLPGAFEEAIDLLDSVDYPVNLIVDATDANQIPSWKITDLKVVAQAPTMSHPNTAEFLAIGLNQYMRIMFKVFRRVFPEAASRYKLFKSREELDTYLNPAAKK